MHMAVQGCVLYAYCRILLFVRRARQIKKHVSYAAYHTATDINIRKSVYVSISETTVRVSSSCTDIVRY